MAARLLIMDPVSTQRIVLRAVLSGAFHDVTLCNTWAELMRMVPALRPQIVLCNASGTPRLGFAALKAVSPKAAPLVLAITADTVDARMKAFDDGADDVVSSPVDQVLLLARVRRLMRMRAADTLSERIFGLGEPERAFLRDPRVLRVLPTPDDADPDADPNASGLPARKVLAPTFRPGPADVFLVEAAEATDESALDLLGNLLSAHTEVPTVLRAPVALAARALDMGAADVVTTRDPGDLLMRIRKLAPQGVRGRPAPPRGLPDADAARAMLSSCLAGRAGLEPPTAVLMAILPEEGDAPGARAETGSDTLLEETARVMRNALDPGDRVFRYAPARLLAVLPSCGAAGARRACLRVAHALAGDPSTSRVRLGLAVNTGPVTEADMMIDSLPCKAAASALEGTARDGLPRRPVSLPAAF